VGDEVAGASVGLGVTGVVGLCVIAPVPYS
jgi:hypothetical protein